MTEFAHLIAGLFLGLGIVFLGFGWALLVYRGPGGRGTTAWVALGAWIKATVLVFRTLLTVGAYVIFVATCGQGGP
jgi:hypothetical protein